MNLRLWRGDRLRCRLQIDAGVYFIGTIRTPWRTRGECPKRGSPDGPICSIVVDERWRAALTDLANPIARFQALYWMHPRAPRSCFADAIPHRADHRQLCVALAGTAEPDRLLDCQSGGNRGARCCGCAGSIVSTARR